jgi:hypothetical protein
MMEVAVAVVTVVAVPPLSRYKRVQLMVLLLQQRCPAVVQAIQQQYKQQLQLKG